MRASRAWLMAALAGFLATASCATLSESLGAKPDPLPALDAKPDRASAETLYNTYKVLPSSVGARVGLRACTREDALAYMRASGSNLDLGGYERGKSEDDLGSALFVFLAIPAMLAASHDGHSTNSVSFQLNSSAAREFSQAVERFNLELVRRLDLHGPLAEQKPWPSVDAVMPIVGSNAGPEDWVRAYQVRYWNGDPTVGGLSSRDIAAYMARQGEGEAAKLWEKGEQRQLTAVFFIAAAAAAALWTSVQHPGDPGFASAPIYGLSGLSLCIGWSAAKRGEHQKDAAREAFNGAMEKKIRAKFDASSAH